jgi:hypothetical protein
MKKWLDFVIRLICVPYDSLDLKRKKLCFCASVIIHYLPQNKNPFVLDWNIEYLIV